LILSKLIDSVMNNMWLIRFLKMQVVLIVIIMYVIIGAIVGSAIEQLIYRNKYIKYAKKITFIERDALHGSPHVEEMLHLPSHYKERYGYTVGQIKDILNGLAQKKKYFF